MKEGFIPKNDYQSIFFSDKAEEGISDIKSLFLSHLEYSLIKDTTTVKPWDVYYALALSLRDRLIERWLRTQYEYRKQDVKKVYYLSMEFLIGRLLGNSLINLDLYNDSYDMLKRWVCLETCRTGADMGLAMAFGRWHGFMIPCIRLSSLRIWIGYDLAFSNTNRRFQWKNR
jgi:hypothetical protein